MIEPAGTRSVTFGPVVSGGGALQFRPGMRPCGADDQLGGQRDMSSGQRVSSQPGVDLGLLATRSDQAELVALGVGHHREDVVGGILLAQSDQRTTRGDHGIDGDLNVGAPLVPRS